MKLAIEEVSNGWVVKVRTIEHGCATGFPIPEHRTLVCKDRVELLAILQDLLSGDGRK